MMDQNSDVVSMTEQTGQVLCAVAAQVVLAGVLFAERPGVAAAGQHLRCQELLGVLQECGVVPDPDLLAAGPPTRDPYRLLRAAADGMDAVEPGQHPTRLVVARAGLTGLMATSPAGPGQD